MCLLPLEFLTESWRGLKLGVSHPQGWLGSGKIASLEGRPLKEKQSASKLFQKGWFSLPPAKSKGKFFTVRIC